MARVDNPHIGLDIRVSQWKWIQHRLPGFTLIGPPWLQSETLDGRGTIGLS